jgi:hypothetical protein
VDIPTSRDPDTPQGLESLAELPHSTELELGKLYQIRMDSSRASTLKLLRGLLTSREVLQPLEPHLPLYCTKNELGSTI